MASWSMICNNFLQRTYKYAIIEASGADPGGDISPPIIWGHPPQYFRLLEKWSKIAKNSVISENFRLRRAVCCFYCARLLEKCSKFAKTFVIPENFRLRRAVLSLSFQLIFNIESIPPKLKFWQKVVNFHNYPPQCWTQIGTTAVGSQVPPHSALPGPPGPFY